MLWSVPLGPSTVPAGKEAGGHQRVPGELSLTPTQAQDVKLGRSREGTDIVPHGAWPASPPSLCLSPFSRLHCGFKPGVAGPWDSDSASNSRPLSPASRL